MSLAGSMNVIVHPWNQASVMPIGRFDGTKLYESAAGELCTSSASLIVLSSFIVERISRFESPSLRGDHNGHLCQHLSTSIYEHSPGKFGVMGVIGA